MSNLGSGGRQARYLFGLLFVPLALSLAVGGCPIGGDDNNNANDNTNTNANENTNTNANDNTTGNTGLTGKYVGSARCALCHNNTHAKWSETLHATALESLEAIGQGSNSSCVGCHTVGFGEEGGFVNRATTNDLAGVGCEACHGPGGDHVGNIEEESLRPPKSISASVCGACHTGEHHPNFEDWESSAHSGIQETLIEEFSLGDNAESCGICHSGDVFIANLNGDEIADDMLAGKTEDELNPITCAVCHDPHERTGNATTPEDGRDYQLRFEQIKYTEPTNTIAAATDPSRFNLCGQCHHARDRVWTATSREPHPSDQVNVFFGEMPLPDSDPTPIIPPRPSVHLNTAEQCSTCHVFRADIIEGIAPAVSGHTFEVNFDSCAECHGNAEAAEAKLAGLEAEVDFRAELVLEALDAWTDTYGLFWEYTSEGGPPSDEQAKIPDEIKKARYIYYYVVSGGGNGAHNPDFVREGLMYALDYAESAPAPLP